MCTDLRCLLAGLLKSKLAQALALTRKEDGLSLQSDELFIEEGFDVKPRQIESGPRIGVEYAGKHARWPLRFWIS